MFHKYIMDNCYKTSSNYFDGEITWNSRFPFIFCVLCGVFASSGASKGRGRGAHREGSRIISRSSHLREKYFDLNDR